MNSKELSNSESRNSDKTQKLAARLAEFDEIIKQTKKSELDSFLREKTAGYAKEFKKHITKYRTAWLSWNHDIEFTPSPHVNLGFNPSMDQRVMVTLSAIALLEKSQIRPWQQHIVQLITHYKNEPIIEVVLMSIKSEWLAETLNEISNNKNSNLHLSYPFLLSLEKKEIVLYHPHLFARSIAEFGKYLNYWEDNASHDTWSFLINTEETTKRDLVEIFNYETPINISRGTYTYNKDSNWPILMQKLIESDFIQRDFVLENCLLIQTKNWDNLVRSSFRDLFEAMSPTSQELIRFQHIVFSLLSDAHFSVVNLAINLCKRIYTEGSFDITNFVVSAAPILIRNDIKTSIKSTITILEYFLKKDSPMKGQICLMLCDCFSQSDASIQEKAATVLAKYGNFNLNELREKVTSYSNLIQSNSKKLLMNHLELSVEVDESQKTVSYKYDFSPNYSLGDPILIPNNWNEILKLIGKFKKTRDRVDAEVLWLLFLTRQDLFPSNLNKELEPYRTSMYSTFGDRSFTDITFKILRIKAGLPKSMFDPQKKLDQYEVVEGEPKNLYELIEYRMQRGIKLSLLSIPTHYPCFIEPVTLMIRLIEHEKFNEPIHTFDLALAIGRMVRTNIEEASALLSDIPKKYRTLMSYCLGLTSNIEVDTKNHITKIFSKITGNQNSDELLLLWAVAARTFDREGYFPAFEDTEIGEIPNVTKPYYPEWIFDKEMSSYISHETNQLKTVFFGLKPHLKYPHDKYIPPTLIYSDEYSAREGSHKDWKGGIVTESCLKATLYEAPRDSERVASKLLSRCNKHYRIPEEAISIFLKLLTQPDQKVDPSSNLVLAISFFNDDKSLRLNASEALFQFIELEKLDTVDFGKKAALSIDAEYGVFQRLLDGILTIKDASSKHNSALAQIFDSMLVHLVINENLPSGFKKLLESFADVKIKTNFTISPQAIAFLERWKEIPSLRKLIQEITN
ncbi:MAG: DUF6493 family protein [Flavobacteriales bacterium]